MRPSYIVFLFPIFSSSFTIYPMANGRGDRLSKCEALYQTEGLESDEGNQGLILDAQAVAQQMASFKSKYPTTEADYLAAARARAAAKAESVNNEATDEDWKQVKEKTKAQGGDVDDWEVSAREAGNIDSQILIPLATDDDDEPKLMLF